jgi:DNA replication protein DnaC
VLLGDSGTGKSHLLIGLGVAACEQGCIIRAKTNSGSGPIRTPFRFIPNKLPAESERGQ